MANEEGKNEREIEKEGRGSEREVEWGTDSGMSLSFDFIALLFVLFRFVLFCFCIAFCGPNLHA